VRWPAHARSGLQLEQAAGSRGEKKREEACAKKKRVWEKKLEERNKIDLNKI
jgi:hypothetical protein